MYCCLGLHAHILDIISLAMPCLDLHVRLHVLCSSAYVHVDHMLVCLSLHSPIPLCLNLHAYMCISMLICVDWCVYMLRSMFSTCFMPSSMCLRASRHVYVLRPRPCLSCHVLL